MSLKPLLFVVMPFGRKPDTSGRFDIDFDEVYTRAIKPAAERAGVDVVRADEEIYGGPIHVAMYERLLLAEIAVADLTLSNANVFYELGIRHAARPRSTILIYAKGSHLPFDVSPFRAIPYELQEGTIAENNLGPFMETLADHIARARANSEHTDSPLFQYLPGLQPLTLAREVSETFRDRTVAIALVQERIRLARQESSHEKAREQLAAIKQELEPFAQQPHELLLELTLAYRAVSAWDDMIRCIDKFPADLRTLVTVQEQHALALNRRGGPGDRQQAITTLRRLIQEHGASPETNSILGRTYKDLYIEQYDRGHPGQATAALEEAIQWYVAGFEADPRDYYPGVNAVTLLLLKGGQDARARVRELRPVVTFAIARRGGLSSNDYWDVASAFEIAATAEDWETAERAAGRLCMLAQEAWMLESTVNNSQLVRRWLSENGRVMDRLDAALDTLRECASEIEGTTPPAC